MAVGKMDNLDCFFFLSPPAQALRKRLYIYPWVGASTFYTFLVYWDWLVNLRAGKLEKAQVGLVYISLSVK